MEKPTYKLVGAPCGHHGQYTFYKALRVSGATEKILAIGDFFFVKIWQDSELVSIGELQLLWTDRVSEQTLVSLRLYCLPENTPDGRHLHGEDEVLAINDKVVVRVDDLLSWMCSGHDWTYGLRAVWRGACAPPPADARRTAPLHHTRLDFSDVEKEKSAIAVDAESPGVVVFSYPRYCRYRALLSRLEGMQAAWLRDSLVAALGGYAAPTANTRILYCKDTFEYPELEGHEFVCNHLAPKLKGRPRGRRRRPPRSRTHSPESRSSEDERPPLPEPPASSNPRRLSLRNGLEKRSSDSDPEREPSEEDRAFLRTLRHFHKDKGASFTQALSLKHLSLRALYTLVLSRGGYEAVCRLRLWKPLFHAHHANTRSVYERFLLPFENHERRNGVKANGVSESEPITVCDSPPPPREQRDCETGEVKEEAHKQKVAEELNREFLDSLPKDDKPLKITVKPVEKLINVEKLDLTVEKRENALEKEFENKYEEGKWNLAEKWKFGEEKRSLGEEKRDDVTDGENKEGFLNELANKLNLGNSDTSLLAELARRGACIPPTAAPAHTTNGHADFTNEQKGARPPGVGRSSLRAVRVKPARAHTAPNTRTNTPPVPPLRPDSASSSPPTVSQSTAAPVTNFGIHHPPPAAHTNTHNNDDDDEIVEVPYKPKTPEIIDLDEYPESPQAVKKKKLDILKERGLEVTPLPAPNWPAPVLATPIIAPNPMLLNPAVQHQIMANAQLYQMYNIIPQSYNGMQPPKVIQATPLYGTTSPEKTVYGNPKDPFMPPPHVLHGAPIKPAKSVLTPPPPALDILDLTCKLTTKPAVEIVRVPTTPSPSKNTAQNLTKNYSIVDGKAVVGSNLEITLVNKAQPLSPVKKQTPQKRSSNGKFTKTPTPPKEYPKPYKKTPIIVPTYQVREDSPTSSTSSQNSQKTAQSEPKLPFDPTKQFLDPSKSASPYLDPSKLPPSFLDPTKAPVGSFLDPSKGPVSSFLDPYMALYNLAGQMDPRQLAAYREIMANPFRYSSLLNMGVNPTTKN